MTFVRTGSGIEEMIGVVGRRDSELNLRQVGDGVTNRDPRLSSLKQKALG